MKKILCLLFVFVLVGCSKTATVSPVTRNLSFEAEIKYYNESYEISANIDKNGKISIVFIHPDELKSTEFTITDGVTTAEIGGLSYDYSDSKNANIFNFIYEIFKDENPRVYKADNIFFIKGQFDGFEYKLFVGASGLPLSIADQSGRFEILFKNPTIK